VVIESHDIGAKFCKGAKEMNFEAKRTIKTATFSLAASPQKVFPLLCPKRELEWVPAWEYEMVYSKSGYIEAGCIFKSRKPHGLEMIWTNVEYDPENYRIGFLNVAPGVMVFHYRIRLTKVAAESCEATCEQIFTGLTEEGNRLIGQIAESSDNSAAMIAEPLNFYLKTGKLINAAFGEELRSGRP
jgi:hypothetical protein